ESTTQPLARSQSRATTTQIVAGRDASLLHPDRAKNLSLPVPRDPKRNDCNTTVRAAPRENDPTIPCLRTDAAPPARATRPHAPRPQHAARPAPRAERARD